MKAAVIAAVGLVGVRRPVVVDWIVGVGKQGRSAYEALVRPPNDGLRLDALTDELIAIGQRAQAGIEARGERRVVTANAFRDRAGSGHCIQERAWEVQGPDVLGVGM